MRRSTPMKDVEVELRRVMREHAAAITSPPPLPGPLTDRRRAGRPGKGRRRAVIVAVAATLALGAGVALSQVLDDPEPPTVDPLTERLVVASGETADGPWQLTAYLAEVSVPRRTETGFSQEVGIARCLDLDGPLVEEPDDPPMQRANACTFEDSEAMVEPIGGVSRHPDFSDGEALVFGEISSSVVSLDVERDKGGRVEATIVRAPAEWDLPVDYFFAFIAGQGKVDLIARDSNEEVLEEQRI
jgi:hypothetical protein